MSRKSAERKHDQTADPYQRAFVQMIKAFSYGQHTHTVFADFVELAALSISNSVDRTQFEAREKRYLEIVGKYKREDVERFPRMLGALTLSFEHRMQVSEKAGTDAVPVFECMTDVLGETYMMLELGNARAGQFFTPYHVSRLMAMMTTGDGQPHIRQHGFLRMQEPACGAGGMVIATAESLAAAGHNYQQTMHATCVDIDPVCVHMAYLQLSLLHIPAIVVHGNTLTGEVWGVWYTPAHVMGGWRWKLRRRERELAEAARALGAEMGGTPPADGVPEPEPEIIDAIESSVSTPLVDDEDGDVAVAEPEVISARAYDRGTIFDLFEDAVEQTSPAAIFAAIDQMTLF
ncbi:N-6 DNA methylase [Burkholderia sp. Bp8998]|uniref:N-6 DNA methylase n=1 Tax=Burkholderia sp. Bp8998 TaxID=2184557 RepID=UPI000F5A9F81|nr:N-6 DNA methylase [Burkholderia sp. Bp8998]RQS11579.1 SAM-dependent DNA methyltransferase [Burkholderia sp. Bp8998]